MNPEDYSREDLLNANLGTPWLVAGLFVAFLLWAISLKYRSRIASRGGRIAAAMLGALLLGGGIWFAFQLAARWLALATAWPLWVLAVIGGLAAEMIIVIYRLERSIVTPAWRGRAMLALRLLALAVLLIVLAQPVRSFLVEREINREVAILFDDSDSMKLSDQRLTASEMLDRAELFEVSAVSSRPPIGALADSLVVLRKQLALEQAAFDGVPDPDSVLESRKEAVAESLKTVGDVFSRLIAQINEIEKEAAASVPEEMKGLIKDLKGPLENVVAGALKKAKQEVEAHRSAAYLEQIAIALQVFEGTSARLPVLREGMDQHFLDQLPDTDRDEVAAAAGKPRIEIARAALAKKLRTFLPESDQDGGQTEEEITFLGQLGERYNLRYYRFARDVGEFSDAEALFGQEEASNELEPDSGAGMTTNLAGALAHVLDNSSPESLAGVLLLSDGRFNGGEIPEDALRQLGVQNSPLSVVPIGGRLGPVDASILSLTAPESIYLGDRVGIKAEVKFDGLRGQEVKAVLKHHGEVVDEQVVGVPDISFRTDLRFVHLPEEKGIYDYEVELEPIGSELFDTNNRWSFKTAVTDDRTNVLLVDAYPRWEFRYLRNLFYGRDKSVHLQYVLLRPDRIEGVGSPTNVAASATRAFGDAKADSLPENIEEWKLFDVIILGDVPPGAISLNEWVAIRESVHDRGALLVCIGGPRYMPHAHESRELRNLLPVTWEENDQPMFQSPEPAYRIALSSAGRSHPVMTQSNSRSLNAQLWAQMPPATWRTTVSGIKEGAEVLAFADSLDGSQGSGAVALDGSPESVERAIEQLANRKTYEQERALVTVQRVGLGKVAMLNFDQTWRLRYGVGDTYHHRFWGQLVRWGAGENLRSGGERVRLGTDRITYTSSDSVQIIAKLLDADRRPITDADLAVVVSREGDPILSQKMSYRSGSSGIYETSVASLSEAGDYSVKLEGEAIDQALAEDPSGLTSIETQLVVVASRNPVELAELTADRDFLGHAAQISGGKVAEVSEVGSLLQAFGAPRETLTERRNITLWDKWPLIVMFLGFLTAEWVIRRRSGLA